MTKRIRSLTLSCRLGGGAETLPPERPACSCTALASPPFLGGGCGGRNQRSVPKGGTGKRRKDSTDVFYVGPDVSQLRTTGIEAWMVTACRKDR